MEASRNQGNFSKDTNNSSPPISSQNPCGETLATSTAEVPVPSGADFISVFLNPGQRDAKLPIVQTMILRQGYLGLKPELCFPIRALHMDVATKFFAREEIEPENSVPKNRWAHCTGLRDRKPGRGVSA